MNTRGHARDDALGVTCLTVTELAGLLRVSPMTIYRLIGSGELTGIRAGRGRCIGVPEPAVRDFLASHRVAGDTTPGRFADLQARLRQAGQDTRTIPLRDLPPLP